MEIVERRTKKATATQNSTNSNTIFCGVVQHNLKGPFCPLQKDVCMWQHRVHKGCCYTSEDISANEYAKLVGLPTISNETLGTLTRSISFALKEEIA